MRQIYSLILKEVSKLLYTPANIFSQAWYKLGLDKSYKHIWTMYDFQ